MHSPLRQLRAVVSNFSFFFIFEFYIRSLLSIWILENLYRYGCMLNVKPFSTWIPDTGIILIIYKWETMNSFAVRCSLYVHRALQFKMIVHLVQTIDEHILLFGRCIAIASSFIALIIQCSIVNCSLFAVYQWVQCRAFRLLFSILSWSSGYFHKHFVYFSCPSCHIFCLNGIRHKRQAPFSCCRFFSSLICLLITFRSLSISIHFIQFIVNACGSLSSAQFNSQNIIT